MGRRIVHSFDVSDAAYGEMWQQPPVQEQEELAESRSDHADSRQRRRKRQQRMLRLRCLSGYYDSQTTVGDALVASPFERVSW
jgi:hypothetical protein